MGSAGHEVTLFEHRPDIDGLRALSVALVLAYHFVPGRLPGGYVGVDVFFVISGYLITLSLCSTAVGTQPTGARFAAFWARRARRLLPNALLVLAASLMLGALLLSDASWRRLGTETAASALYAANWLFVVRATDYLAWDAGQKPWLLHFWSLAVEEQFYLLWPFVVLALWPGIRMLKPAEIARWRIGVLATITAASFGTTLWLSDRDVAQTFFSTFSRCWELAAGAVLAAVHTESAPRLAGRPIRQCVGLVLIGLAAVGFDERTVHPGWATWVPVTGAMLVIGASARGTESLAGRILGSTPATAIGRRAYSIYLWHWPVLTFGALFMAADRPSGLWLLVLAGLIAAELAYRYFEEPARRRWALEWSSRRILLAAVAACIAIALLGFGVRTDEVHEARRTLQAAFGTDIQRSTIVSGTRIADEVPPVYRNGCHLPLPTASIAECEFGAPDGSYTVVAFGDSQAAQWFSAFDAAAKAGQARFRSWTKSSCPAADVVSGLRNADAAQSCMQWRQAALDRIVALRPSWVLLAGAYDPSGPVIDADGRHWRDTADIARAWQNGLVRTITRLQDAGIGVIVLRGMPSPRADVIDCLYSASDADACARPRRDALMLDVPEIHASKLTGARLWDFSAAICGAERCPVLTTQGVLVYRDAYHLTDSFVRTLAGAVEAEWSRARADATLRTSRR